MSGSRWTAAESKVLRSLKSPSQIQDFLDRTPYSTDEFYRSPRSVMRDGVAHCVDGALFAAAALRRLGHPPLLMDLRAIRDDDHVLTIYRRDGFYGAVAKSNCTGLRFREPIHKTLRELAMTYFDPYFNTLGEKTLRSYSALLDLSRLDHLAWMTRDDGLVELIRLLDAKRHYALVTPAQIEALCPVDKRSFDAGFLGSNPAGLYKPEPPAKPKPRKGSR